MPSVSTTPDPVQADTSAHLTVNVPEDAEVWVEGWKSSATGVTRRISSPPLTPGKRYTYDVRARWQEDGHEVTQEQKVAITAGDHASLDFPAHTGTTRMPAAE